MATKILSRMFLLFALICFSLSMGSCALLAPVAEKTQKGVDSYCQKLTYTERHLIRNSINPTPNGNTVHVHCLGDPPESG